MDRPRGFLVCEDAEKGGEGPSCSGAALAPVRYSEMLLQGVFQFMGVKARKATKMVTKCMERVEHECPRLESALAEVVITRSTLNRCAQNVLKAFGYKSVEYVRVFAIACRIRERKQSVTILLCGTSGCGKSTLASLLASRLGIGSVMSTDSIRHMMRSFDEGQQNELLWLSTYEAALHLDKDPRLAPLALKKKVVKGYKAQCEMVLEHLDNLITFAEERHESMIVEGVHLSMNFIVQLMRRHPSILPFVLFISNEYKHRERFAVRARAMALSPAKNKYVKHFRHIRIIQDYLCKKADQRRVPKIDNSNMDRSLNAVHTTLISYLHALALGTSPLDVSDQAAATLHSEFVKLHEDNKLWHGKEVLKVIRSKASKQGAPALGGSPPPPTSPSPFPPHFKRSGSSGSAGHASKRTAQADSSAVSMSLSPDAAVGGDLYYPHDFSSDYNTDFSGAPGVEGAGEEGESGDDDEGETSTRGSFRSDQVSETGSVFGDVESQEDSDLEAL